MKAIVLTAGTGTRLRPYTDDRPKCLVELGGKTLLDRQIAAFRSRDITDVTIVAGYHAERFSGHGYAMIINPRYDSTNMVETLFCARHLMTGDADLIVSYGDIVYEPAVLDALVESAAPVSVVVDRKWRAYWERRFADPLADAETLRLDFDGYILELGKRPGSLEEIEAQYIGLIKFNRSHVPALLRTYENMDRERLYDGRSFETMFMTSFLQFLIDSAWRVKAVPVNGGWLELDTVGDLNLYEDMLRKGTLKEFYAAD
jgi:choline kinase